MHRPLNAHGLGPGSGRLNRSAVRQVIIADSRPFGLGSTWLNPNRERDRQDAKPNEKTTHGTLLYKYPNRYLS
jgi:hypothetical protein